MGDQVAEAPPIYQAKAYNQKVGGVERKLEPIVDLDPLPQISHLARELEFDVNHVFQVNLHRWRTRVSETFRGDTVPEGAHRDGHHITSVTCWSRENIEGGESVLYHIGKHEPFLTTILEPGECLVLREEDLIHGALPIALKNGADEGHRDIFVISINPWGDRRYGREFEAFSKAKS